MLRQIYAFSVQLTTNVMILNYRQLVSRDRPVRRMKMLLGKHLRLVPRVRIGVLKTQLVAPTASVMGHGKNGMSFLFKSTRRPSYLTCSTFHTHTVTSEPNAINAVLRVLRFCRWSKATVDLL